jgi:hypothetical protein
MIFATLRASVSHPSKGGISPHLQKQIDAAHGLMIPILGDNPASFDIGLVVGTLLQAVRDDF